MKNLRLKFSLKFQPTKEKNQSRGLDCQIADLDSNLLWIGLIYIKAFRMDSMKISEEIKEKFK